MVLKKSLSSPFVVGGSVSILALGLWAWAHRPADLAPGVAGVERSGASFWVQAGPDRATTTAKMAPVFKTGVENLPQSLQGTQVPEGLAEDAAGNLVITQGLKDVFDYFLSAVVDEPLETVHARMMAYIKAHLGSKAAQRALAILDQYGAYKMDSPSLAKSYSGDRPDQVQARLAAIQNLRRSSLGPEVAQAFFGEEESWVQYTLSKADVLQNNALSPQQKSTRIAELRKQLSPNLQASIATSEMLQSLDEAHADWKKRGGTPEELRAAREAIVGKDGAARLETLDSENAAWDARMNAHLAQRAQILSDPAIAPEMKPQRVEALRKQNFTHDEQMRVTALEGLHDETAGAPNAR